VSFMHPESPVIVTVVPPEVGPEDGLALSAIADGAVAACRPIMPAPTRPAARRTLSPGRGPRRRCMPAGY